MNELLSHKPLRIHFLDKEIPPETLWDRFETLVKRAMPYAMSAAVGVAFGYAWCWFALTK